MFWAVLSGWAPCGSPVSLCVEAAGPTAPTDCMCAAGGTLLPVGSRRSLNVTADALVSCQVAPPRLPCQQRGARGSRVPGVWRQGSQATASLREQHCGLPGTLLLGRPSHPEKNLLAPCLRGWAWLPSLWGPGGGKHPGVRVSTRAPRLTVVPPHCAHPCPGTCGLSFPAPSEQGPAGRVQLCLESRPRAPGSPPHGSHLQQCHQCCAAVGVGVGVPVSVGLGLAVLAVSSRCLLCPACVCSPHPSSFPGG